MEGQHHRAAGTCAAAHNGISGRINLGALATALLLAGVPSGRAAAVYTAQENAAGFGTVNQSAVFGPGIGASGINSCAPTATMNSFTYLENTYPWDYPHNDLMGGQATWTQAAIQLALNMDTTTANATSLQGWVAGKVGWFTANAPAQIRYAGMGPSFSVNGSFPASTAYSWYHAATPTPAFLLQELQSGEDVEIGIVPAFGVSHVLTLTGIVYHNASGNPNSYGGRDTVTLNTIDPANPGVNTQLVLNPGTMTISGANPSYGTYSIAVALAESPVPEGSTTIGLLLMGLTVTGLLHRRLTATATAG